MRAENTRKRTFATKSKKPEREEGQFLSQLHLPVHSALKPTIRRRQIGNHKDFDCVFTTPLTVMVPDITSPKAIRVPGNNETEPERSLTREKACQRWMFIFDKFLIELS